jgi:hypothetical protein
MNTYDFFVAMSCAVLLIALGFSCFGGGVVQ